MKRGEPYIRAINLLGHQEFFESQGCDFLAMLDEVGIARDALQEFDSLISFRAYVAIFEAGASRSGNPNFGLQLAQSLGPDYLNLGPSLLMARFAANVGEWVDNSLRYWSYHTNGFSMSLGPAEDVAGSVLRIDFNALTIPTRHYVEAVTACIVGVVRVIADEPDENPSLVRFNYRRPNDISLHQSIFRCPFEFGCENVEIRFPTRLLEHPVKGGLRLLQPLMRLYIEERIRRMRIYDHSARATVALAIPAIMGSGNCTLEAVAISLGKHVKALQRQLEKEETSFSEILDNVRETMARHLLTESEAPVSRIAGLLDYADTPPFSMAFRRWTGQTPLEYRRRSRTADLPDLKLKKAGLQKRPALISGK